MKQLNFGRIASLGDNLDNGMNNDQLFFFPDFYGDVIKTFLENRCF